MDFHPGNTDVILDVAYVDANGKMLSSVLSIVSDVYDMDDVIIGTINSDLPASNAKSFSVTVPKELNSVSPGDRTLRKVVTNFNIDPAAGKSESVVKSEAMYIVGSKPTLKVASNSFASLAQFHLEAIELLTIAGWSNASDDRKVAALIQAFRNISGLTFEYTPLDEKGEYKVGEVETLEPMDWHHMSANHFEDLPPAFRQALIRAQILEANELLQGNVFASRIKAGVKSETIGESSVSFNTSVRQHSVSSAVVQTLNQYIVRRFEIARA